MSLFSDSAPTINILADIDGVSSGPLSGAKTITVNGNGHTVRLASGNSCFSKMNSNMSIAFKAVNCSFINNKATSSSGIGGALKGKVDLVNCTFYGNEARDEGGAIYSGAAGTITNGKCSRQFCGQ